MRPDVDGRDKRGAIRFKQASLALYAVMVGEGRPSTSLPAQGSGARFDFPITARTFLP
jgi:hypothetical protein